MLKDIDRHKENIINSINNETIDHEPRYSSSH